MNTTPQPIPVRSRSLRRATAAAGALLAGGGLFLAATVHADAAAAGCKVDYSVNQWSTGFTANLIVTNLGDPITSGWKLEWDYAGNQTVTQAWNAVATQSGTHVTLTNASWNAALPTNGTANPGFNATYSGTNATPASFKLNGVTCTGGTTATTPPTTPATTTPTTPPTTAPTTPPASNALYASPSGTAGASGTQSDPTTIASAITRVAAGGTIYLRGGTYALSQTVTIAAGNDGTASARKTLSAYPGETPVLNFSAMATADANRGLALNGNYWHLNGLVVEHAGDNGIFVGGSNNIVERAETRFNRDSGLQISRISSSTPSSQWPSNNLVVSSQSHDNMDATGENADGFAAKLTAGPGNVFQYDVSHNNIDDGWDLYTKTDTGPIGIVTIEDSLSYNNGTLTDGTVNANGDRNGYKLGGEDIPVNHVIVRDIAYHNGHHGFTYNSNPGSMTISNNISIDNAERNFAFDEGTSTFRNDTSCRFSVSGSNDKTVGTTDSSDQFWSGANGSRCSSLSGALGWSFAADGHLVVTLGGKTVTP